MLSLTKNKINSFSIKALLWRNASVCLVLDNTRSKKKLLHAGRRSSVANLPHRLENRQRHCSDIVQFLSAFLPQTNMKALDAKRFA